MTPLFSAVIEATEEAVYNALFAARSVTDRQGDLCPELPVQEVLDLLRNAKQIR